METKLTKLGNTINLALAVKKQLSKNTIKKIEQRQYERDDIEFHLDVVKNIVDIRYLFKMWTNANYDLQELWGFEVSWRMHKGYLLKQCSCPRMDNDDAGFHEVVNMKCKLHNSRNNLLLSNRESLSKEED